MSHFIVDHFKARSKVYALVLIRWTLIVALVFSGVMAIGMYVTDHMLEKVYSATAVLRVQTQPVSAEAYGGWAFSTPQSRAIKAQLASIESPEILRAVIDSLALDKAWGERIYDREDPLPADEARHYLESHLHLNFKHDTRQVEVTAMSDDPKEAAAIANRVADFYKASRAALAKEEALAPGNRSAAPGAVEITTRAAVPPLPTWPKRRYCYAIAAGFAGMLSVMIASSVEVCLLIARSEAASGELKPPR